MGENTRFVYGLGGELIAEFDGTNGALKKEYVSGGLATIEPTALNSNGTRYSTGDHLGSPRVVTNSSGSVVSRHDYLPFGEELFAGTGGRTTALGYTGSDGARQKFTGYEADTETGLNFAQARYQSATQGRFTSPDPFGGSMSPLSPQSFNRYSYVSNNPVNSTDPTGMFNASDEVRSTRWVMSESFGVAGEQGEGDHIHAFDWTNTFQTSEPEEEGNQQASQVAGSTQQSSGGDVTGYDLVTSGPAPNVDHPEIPNLSNLGTYTNVNGAFFAFVLRVNFAAGVNVNDYQALRTAFILYGNGSIDVRQGSPTENPTKGQTVVQGQSRLVYDNPGLGRALVAPNTLYKVVFVAGEYNKKSKQLSPNVAFHVLNLVIDKHNLASSTLSSVVKIGRQDAINLTKSVLPKHNGQLCIECTLKR